jgi:putative heme-binding domain-containing protein
VVDWLEQTLAADHPLPALATLEQLLYGLASRPTEHAPASWPDAERLESLLAGCRARAADPRADMSQRVAAISVLAAAAVPSRANVSVLLSLLEGSGDETLQFAAIRALQRLATDDVPAELLRRQRGLTHSVRERALGALLSRADWTRQLLEAILTETVHADQLSLAQQQQLLRHQDQAVRQLAVKLLPARFEPDRPQIVAQYAQPPWPAGDARRGREVFTAQCAACHLVGGTGHAVGPEITGYATKPYEALLVAVLDPNQAVDPRYVQHSVTTTDGRILSGIVSNETATGLVVTDAQGRATTLLRSEVERVASLGVSLMPEGLERELPPAAMADLFAFLATENVVLGRLTAEDAEGAE